MSNSMGKFLVSVAAVTCAACSHAPDKPVEQPVEQVVQQDEETAAKTLRAPNPEELERFIQDHHFRVYGAWVSVDHVDLDGEGLPELVIKAQCDAGRCVNNLFTINSTAYYVYRVVGDGELEMFHKEPVFVSETARVTYVDVDGDGNRDLLFDDHPEYGERRKGFCLMKEDRSGTRRELLLTPNLMDAVLIDIDADGAMDLITYHFKISPPAPYNYYMPPVLPELGKFESKFWSIRPDGSIGPALEVSADDLQAAFERVASRPDADALVIAQHLVAMKQLGIKPPGLDQHLNKIMKRFGVLTSRGDSYTRSYQYQYAPTPQDNIAGDLPTSQPDYGMYGGPYYNPSFTSFVSPERFLLLYSLAGWDDSSAVVAWSEKMTGKVRSHEELGLLTELIIDHSSEGDSGEIVAARLEEALDVLLEIPEPANPFDYGTFSMSVNEVGGKIWRAHGVAVQLSARYDEFDEVNEVLRRSYKKLVKKPNLLNQMFTQSALGTAFVPVIIEQPASKLSPEVADAVATILDGYVGQLEAKHGEIPKDQVPKLAKFIKGYISSGRGTRMDLFVRLIKPLGLEEDFAARAKSLKKKFLSGRMSQTERYEMANVGYFLLDISSHLSKSERDWWVTLFYKQSSQYALEGALSQRCYELATITDEQRDEVFEILELIPDNFITYNTCIMPIVERYKSSAELAVPEPERERARAFISGLVKKSSSAQDIAMNLRYAEDIGVEDLTGLARKIWSRRRRRPGTDSARHQALVLLAASGDAAAIKALRETHEKIFSDFGWTSKTPDFLPDTFFQALVSRDKPEDIERLIELVGADWFDAGYCFSLNITFPSSALSIAMTEEQRKQIYAVCPSPYDQPAEPAVPIPF